MYTLHWGKRAETPATLSAQTLGLFGLTAREFEGRFKGRFPVDRVSGEWFKQVPDVLEVERIAREMEAEGDPPKKRLLGREMCELMHFPSHWIRLHVVD